MVIATNIYHFENNAYSTSQIEVIFVRFSEFSIWQVDQTDVDSEQSRAQLFLKLMNDATKLEHFLCLSSLLSTWPKMKDVK